MEILTLPDFKDGLCFQNFREARFLENMISMNDGRGLGREYTQPPVIAHEDHVFQETRFAKKMDPPPRPIFPIFELFRCGSVTRGGSSVQPYVTMMSKQQ